MILVQKPPMFLENLKQGGQKATKRANFFTVFHKEVARTEQKRPVFHNKTCPFRVFLRYTALNYPLDRTEAERRPHRTLALNLTHQGPEYRLYYEGFFLSI